MERRLKILPDGISMVPMEDNDSQYWIIRDGKKVGWGTYLTEEEKEAWNEFEYKILLNHEI